MRTIQCLKTYTIYTLYTYYTYYTQRVFFRHFPDEKKAKSTANSGVYGGKSGVCGGIYTLCVLYTLYTYYTYYTQKVRQNPILVGENPILLGEAPTSETL